jgi:hypothetical protein
MLPNAEPPCVELQDKRGLLRTEQLCEQRLEEMKAVIPQMFYPPYVVGAKCEKIGEHL